MATVVVNFNVSPAPPATPVGSIVVAVTDASGATQTSNPITDPTVLSASFTVTTPGAVSAVVTALAPDGTTVVGSASGSGTIPTPPAQLGIPATVTITVS